MPRGRARRALRLVGWPAAVVAIPLVLSMATSWLWWWRPPSPRAHSHGVNALWARHAWVGTAHSPAEYDRLATLLRRGQISDVFFHVGPLDSDGSIPPERYGHARELIAALAARVPTVRAQAYLGQVISAGGGPLHLGNARVRRRVVETAATFLDLGFGGVHYDLEPVVPGDEQFLDLLAETHRLTRRRGAVLSAAVEGLEPVPGAQSSVSRLLPRYHDITAGYLRRVARRVDQVAILTYDTGLPADWLFGDYTAWQTERVARTVPLSVTVFMGVPTYGRGSWLGFHPWAENVRSGVRGVRKGVAGLPAASARRVGVALFAEWTTSPGEWAQYRQAWVSPRA